MKSALRCLCGALGLLIPTAAAQAAVCTVSTTGVAFGAYDSFHGSGKLSTGTIGVSCDVIATYAIGMSAGVAGTFNRAMAFGANRLGYNLFTDATRTVIWGDSSAGTAKVGSSGTTGSVHNVYGRIPARQVVPAGSYTDSIIVTVDF